MLGRLEKPTTDVNEAAEKSGINWSALASLVSYKTHDGSVRFMPNKYVLYKDTTGDALGVVGSKYIIYQNSDMWKFIDEFINNGCSDCKIEAATELNNGSKVCVIIKSKKKEFIKDDEIHEYFVFRNSFDGSSPLQVFFTNIRIVCQNTLVAALKAARKNNTLYNITHTASLSERLEEIQSIILKNNEAQEKFNEAMTFLVSRKLNTNKQNEIIKNVLFPKKSETKRAITERIQNIQTLNELIENGRGADIPGVKGTAYGIYQAFTEWADHYKRIRVPKGRSVEEIRFETNLFTTTAKQKAKVLESLLKYNY